MNTCVLYCRKSSEDKDRQILSLADQEKICGEVAEEKGLTISATYRESKSAKRPDRRPAFAQMMEYVTQKHIPHILCWKADRLCRNAKEGGMLIDLVDYAGLQITTPAMEYDRNTSTFLFIEFGMATKYSKDLSDNVKRGLSTKVQMGWMPNCAPLGYINDQTKGKGRNDILPDPQRFPLCRHWWELMLTGKETVISSLAKITTLGLTSKYANRSVSRTEAYRFFRNIFYTGLFDYNGQRYEGKHTPLITLAEYERVQEIIDGRKHSQTAKNSYYFMQLFTCGECGAAITAEHHTKRYKNGSTQTFVYARCTKKRGRCSQPYVNANALGKQLLTFVASLEIRPSFVVWLKAVLKRRHQTDLATEKVHKGTVTKRLDALLGEKKTLYGMKTEGLISEEEYQKEKKRLLTEEQRIKEQQNEHRAASWSDAIEDVLSCAGNLTRLFTLNDPQIQRMVLALLGSNLTIKERTARIDAKNVFLFLKQAEKSICEEISLLEPEKGLSLQANPVFLPIHSGLAEESVFCSNLQDSITPELTLQIKTLKEHMERSKIDFPQTQAYV